MVTVNEDKMKQNLARNMRYLRMSKSPRISQTMLANKLGVTQSSVSKYESGEMLPPLHILLAMAHCFGYTADELLSETLPGKKGMNNNE